jgi:hypothetical protein
MFLRSLMCFCFIDATTVEANELAAELDKTTTCFDLCT